MNDYSVMFSHELIDAYNMLTNWLIYMCSGDEAVLFKIDDAVMIKAEAAAADHCIQQAQDHDLKGAATLFTLTNCTSWWMMKMIEVHVN